MVASLRGSVGMGTNEDKSSTGRILNLTNHLFPWALLAHDQGVQLLYKMVS